MTSIHKLRCIGANEAGDKAGVEWPKDDLRAEGLIDEDGQLVEEPNVLVSRVAEGKWIVERRDVRDDGDGEAASV